jgi:hypothetical protein
VTVSGPIIIALQSASTGATQVVYNDGALTGGGTHATIAAAITAASAGSIIELRNRTAGSLQTWAQAINVNKSGTAGAPITIRVRDGDRVRIRTNTTLLTITGSHVTVKGNSTGRTGLELGNPNEWNPLVWGGDYLHPRSMIMENCNNVTLENLTAHGCNGNGSVATGNGYYANDIRGTCTDILIRNCEFSKHGTNKDPDGGGERGDILRICAKRCVVADSSFFHGGHNTLFASGPYVVVRRCTFDGYWGDTPTGYPGSRAADFAPAIQTNRFPSDSWPGEWGPMLVEDCTIKNADASLADGGGFVYSPAVKMVGFRVIQRGNYYFDNASAIWLGPGYGDMGTAAAQEGAARCYGYHNTSYNSGGIWRNNDANANAANQREYRFVNNIFADLRDGKGGNGSLMNVIQWDCNAIPLGQDLNGVQYANSWKGTVWRGNVYQLNAGITAANARVQMNGTGSATVNLDNSTQWPANYFNNRLATSISFQNVGTVRNRDKGGFQINSGTGVADADALTRTSSSGTNTTTLSVLDAGFFYDGWNIPGEVGDFIKIGTNAAVQITAVNYATNQITLASQQSWSANTAVVYAGNPGAGNAGTVFDNTGAAQ